MKVREVIRLLRLDGWVLDRQVGSHRQYRHSSKPGTVTVAGNLGAEVKRGTLASILRQAGLLRSGPR
jgi:predicted RNA binding protein YcfA (HicA-like mRNA interferase family)